MKQKLEWGEGILCYCMSCKFVVKYWMSKRDLRLGSYIVDRKLIKAWMTRVYKLNSRDKVVAIS